MFSPTPGNLDTQTDQPPGAAGGGGLPSWGTHCCSICSSC